MLKVKALLGGAVLGAIALASPAAMAGLTANAGAVSEYLFRGVEQSSGVALQGGVDFSTEGGIYLGTWASNTGGPAASGGSEWDLYGGWAGKAGPVGLDFGAIYYLYNEDEEDLGGEGFDYFEIYGKFTVSVFSLQLYYSPAYLGDAVETAADSIGKDSDYLYINGLVNIPLSDTLTLGFQVGANTGDGAEVAWDGPGPDDNPATFIPGDGYIDYSVSLSKTLDNGWSWSLGLFGTTLEQGDGFGTVPADDDSIKPVVGLKKTFDL